MKVRDPLLGTIVLCVTTGFADAYYIKITRVISEILKHGKSINDYLLLNFSVDVIMIEAMDSKHANLFISSQIFLGP